MIPSSLFTVPIWDDMLPNFEAVKDELVPLLLKFKEENPSIKQSNVGGYQSPKTLHQVEELKELFEYIALRVNQVAASIGLDAHLEINESWLNVNDTPGCFNLQHIHGGVISGIFYVNIPEGSGSLFLSNPCPIHMWEGLNICPERNHYASETIEVKPIEGTFIMWPSYLPHAVGANTHNEKRISIAFNSSVKRKENGKT